MIERHFSDHSVTMSFVGYFHRDKPLESCLLFRVVVEASMPNLGSKCYPSLQISFTCPHTIQLCVEKPQQNLQLASESSGEICTMMSEYIKQCTGSFEKLIYNILSTVLLFADSPLLNAVCPFWN